MRAPRLARSSVPKPWASPFFARFRFSDSVMKLHCTVTSPKLVSGLSKRADSDSASSVDQLADTWSSTMRRPATTPIASPSTPDSSPSRERMKRTTTSSAAISKGWSRSVMPSPGAVWPAMVSRPFVTRSGDFSTMVPETSNTTVRGPAASTPARSEPGPLSPRWVTWNTAPPRPPSAKRPAPSAPGKASSAAGPAGMLAGGACTAGGAVQPAAANAATAASRRDRRSVRCLTLHIDGQCIDPVTAQAPIRPARRSPPCS
jgi:hypothetical protein